MVTELSLTFPPPMVTARSFGCVVAVAIQFTNPIVIRLQGHPSTTPYGRDARNQGSMALNRHEREAQPMAEFGNKLRKSFLGAFGARHSAGTDAKLWGRALPPTLLRRLSLSPIFKNLANKDEPEHHG